MFPTLYKRDKDGTIRRWKVLAVMDRVIVEHGVDGGAMQSKVTFASPKNVGKANETSAETQALLEAKSKWNEQVNRNGYRVKEDLDKPALFLEPMLALDATKVGHRINWDDTVMAQRKLDGVRCIWRPDVEKLQSRKGTFYEAPQHIIEALRGINRPLDGELYLHGTPLNEILGASRKYKPLTDKLEFHVFDLAFDGLHFHERVNLAASIVEQLEHPFVHMVYCDYITKDNLLPMHNQYVQEGYEGLMIRHASGFYGFGERSPDLFKYKVFKEAEFLINEVKEDNDGGAVLGLLTDEGYQFFSRPRGTLEYRSSLLDRKCLGQMATVRYFTMTSTSKPVPQFPVVVAIGDLK
jgi:ATP-dependent DNA ligase